MYLNAVKIGHTVQRLFICGRGQIVQIHTCPGSSPTHQSLRTFLMVGPPTIQLFACLLVFLPAFFRRFQKAKAGGDPIWGEAYLC